MTTALFKNIRPKILAEISHAEYEIKAAIGWFTNRDLFEALCQKVKAGINVELIILNDFINNRIDGLDFQYFINIGGNFYFGADDRPMHNKTCIIDRKVLINGSYNWTYYAESKNEENTIIHKENQPLIDDFIDNFNRIRDGLQRVDTVIKNRLSDFELYSLFGTRNYLAQDYLYFAIESRDSSIVEKAFELLPNNIGIQRLAVEHSLKSKRETTMPIIEEIVNDDVVILIPEKTVIPDSGKSIFSTAKDEQISANITIKYGRKEKASENQPIGSFKIEGIPKKKKGEATLITIWNIDIYGMLTITEVIKETGHSATKQYNINHLLKEREM